MLVPDVRFRLVLSVDVLFHLVDDDHWDAYFTSAEASLAPYG